jgi:cell division protein FtsQ
VSARRLTARRAAVVLAWVALAAGVWLEGPRVLARLEFFRVRRVELVGLRYGSSAAVLRALRIPARMSVFDDLRPLERRAGRLPGVATAEVRRRLPGTLVVEVAEREPVALARRRDALVLMDADGRVLPFDPSVAALDLPIATEADAGIGALLGRIQDVEPGLFARISSASREGTDVVLDLGGQRWWFQAQASPEVIRAVMTVAQDLARMGRVYRELDGRFAGQVVVRGKSAPATGPKGTPRGRA